MKDKKSIEDIEKDIHSLKEFHGHIGPYVIIGARMAILSNRLLEKDPFKKSVRIFTVHSPPKSCLMDGIQFFSGCTLGKGNIEIINEEISKAIFKSKKKELIIELKERVNIPKNTSKDELEKIAMEFLKMDENQLFKIELKELSE